MPYWITLLAREDPPPHCTEERLINSIVSTDTAITNVSSYCVISTAVVQFVLCFSVASQLLLRLALACCKCCKSSFASFLEQPLLVLLQSLQFRAVEARVIPLAHHHVRSRIELAVLAMYRTTTETHLFLFQAALDGSNDGAGVACVVDRTGLDETSLLLASRSTSRLR